MMQLQSAIQGIRVVAPVLCIAIVLLVPLWLQREATLAGQAQVNDEAVRRAMAHAPYRIERWIGADVPLPEAAGQLLNPTAVLSRRYVHMDDGAIADIMMIRSADARSIGGHHPPVCYPSNGWVMVEADGMQARPTQRGGSQVQLQLGNNAFNAQRYEFMRHDSLGVQAHIRVFNFFMLPDGAITSDIGEVHRYAIWLRHVTPSVTQVQVLTHMTLSESAAHEAAAGLLCGLTHVFEAAGVNFHGTPK